MQLLNAAAAYTSSKFDLKCIYLTFVRSVLEKSAVVWHSSLNNRNRKDLERVQKAAVRVIMGKSYTTYKNGLKELNIESFAFEMLEGDSGEALMMLWQGSGSRKT